MSHAIGWIIISLVFAFFGAMLYGMLRLYDWLTRDNARTDAGAAKRGEQLNGEFIDAPDGDTRKQK